jgi:hypothetical protein
MGIFIGGDTQSLDYDFGLKVAGSVAECPMKLYKGTIDVNNPPSPFTYPQQISDFTGKVAGSIIENPNVFKPCIVHTYPQSLFAYVETADYNNIATLNGSCRTSSITTNGNIAEHLFSFDLIQLFERTYGTIPGSTDIASKVTWLKDNINTSVTVNYYGYGSCPAGNKVILYAWDGSSTWSNSGSNASSTPTLISITPGVSRIDSNGFMHILAATDASDGVTASVVNTDYISLTVSYKDQSSVVWWQEVSDQKTLDKLKAQNEIPITSTDFTNRTAVWNGKSLVLQTDTIPAVRDDFAGKIINSVVENSNVFKSNWNFKGTSLLVPSSSSWTEENSQNEINILTTLNGIAKSTGIAVADNIPQQLFSFNLIRMLEDKYGSLPCPNDTASKVAWLKQNMKIISCYYSGYGIGPLGSKVCISVYVPGSNSYGGIATLSTSIVSTTRYDCNSPSVVIDSNGMVHFLAYTDAARTTDSTLLVLTGHGLSNGDFIENTTRNAFSTVNTVTINTMTTSNITSQTSGDSIRKYHNYSPRVAESGTNSTTVKITNHGLVTGDGVCVQGKGYSRVTVVDANTFNLDTTINTTTVGDSLALNHFTGTQTAESTVVSSTIYTDYISIDVRLKPTAGYDLLVPSNPRRDAVTGGNYDNIVMAEKVYNQVVSDFTGKVAGSVTENPNIYKYTNASSTLVTPSSGIEITSQSGIDNIKTQNSICGAVTVSTNGIIPQHIFQFNLISIFEKQYGTIPATDKISWLKANLSNITFSWSGYGTCPSGNFATCKSWDKISSAWIQSTITNNTGSITTGTDQITNSYISQYVDNNGTVSYLAYTNASDGVTASTIYTDYVKITLTFNNGNNSLEYFTNNSVEMAVQTTSKASAYLVECDLTPIVTALYGGSNAALKSALKAIQADIYASGYGASSDDVSNGVNYKYWESNSSIWSNYGNSGIFYNNAPLVTDIQSIINTNAGCWYRINSSNKIYILVTSTNNSTVDVPSVVNLDYLKLRVDLTRTPDVINNPPTINLTDTWSILVRGFSPNWDSTTVSTHKAILSIGNDANNKYVLYYLYDGKAFILKNIINGSTINITSNVETISKYDVINFLIQQTSNGTTIHLLINNKTMEKYTGSTMLKLTGLMKLNTLFDTSNTYQSDAFLDSIIYMPSQNWDDTTAEAILRGTKEGFEFPELFDINAVTLHANAARSNGVITLNASAGYQGSYMYIPVLPNNQYEIKSTVTGSGYIQYMEYYNNIPISGGVYSVVNPTSTVFTTGSKTNKIQITLSNRSQGTGAFTFSNISLKLKM